MRLDDTEPVRDIESAVERFACQRSVVFNRCMDQMRDELRAKGLTESQISEAYEAALAHFCEVLRDEARRLSRDLTGILPHRGWH